MVIGSILINRLADEFYFSNIEVDYVKKSYQLNTT
jgi:hypothetical protein